jgi:hypothetical protein
VLLVGVVRNSSCFTPAVVVVVVVVGITESGSHYYYYWQQWWCIQISWCHRNIVDLVQQPKASNRQATKDGHSSNIPTTSSSSCGTHHNIDDDKVIHASMMQSLRL